MKRSFVILFLCVASFCGFSQSTLEGLLPENPKSIKSFLPEGWIKIDIVSGDFNCDGKKDYVVLTIDSVHEKIIGDAHRSLVILEGTSSGFKVSAVCNNAVLCNNCGGVHGDPYNGMKLKGNILSIFHYGGSSRRWAFTEQFQFKNGKWVEIGFTTKGWWLVINEKYKPNDKATSFKSINYLTGEYVEKEIDDLGNIIKNEKGIKAREPLKEIKDFNIAS